MTSLDVRLSPECYVKVKVILLIHLQEQRCSYSSCHANAFLNRAYLTITFILNGNSWELHEQLSLVQHDIKQHVCWRLGECVIWT